MHEAVKIPVVLFGKIRIEGVRRGCIKLTHPEMAVGGVRIGGGWQTEMYGYAQLYPSFLKIEGTIELGQDVIINNGCLLTINKNALLRIGNNFRANTGLRLVAKERIDIGDDCRVGWDCQIMDTSFHYTISKGQISQRYNPILLGHNTWLANGVTVLKGTMLPAYSVVGAKSLVNKDYTEYGEKCLFAGTPAKFKYCGIQRILGYEYEQLIDTCFTDGKEYISEEDFEKLVKGK